MLPDRAHRPFDIKQYLQRFGPGHIRARNHVRQLKEIDHADLLHVFHFNHAAGQHMIDNHKTHHKCHDDNARSEQGCVCLRRGALHTAHPTPVPSAVPQRACRAQSAPLIIPARAFGCVPIFPVA